MYSDNPSVPFRTLPFPKTVSLSGVRSKALILFELQLLRERSKKIPTTYGLTLGKLDSKLPSSPENIVPTYMAKNYRSFNPNLKSFNHAEGISYNYLHLIPPINQVEDLKDCLKRRKKLIIEEEQNFVSKLGMDYIK